MAFNGSGTFLRVMNWTSDAQALINIRADRHDTQDDDYAAGLSNCITRDGQSSPTNDIPMNGHKLINLGAPVAPTDAATKAYADASRPYTGGVVISGADANGLVTFSSLTGVNGLSWAGADLAWVARLATAAGPGTPPVPPATLNRLVLNTKPDGSGTDVITANDDGSLAITGALTSGAITCGVVVSSGSITATPIVAAKAASGNVHFWLYGPNGEDRMVLYTNAAAQGSAFLRVGGTQSFEYNTSGQFKAPGAVFAGASYLDTNGNPNGSVWSQWGSSSAISAISAQIEARATAWANDRVSQLQYRKVSQGNIAASGTGAGTTIVPAGTVVTGMNTNQYYPVSLFYKSLQVFDPVRGWVGFSEQ